MHAPGTFMINTLFKLVTEEQAQICADGCKGTHHLVHIGIIWQNVFKRPIWLSGWSTGCVLTQHQGAKVQINSVELHHFPHFPHNVYNIARLSLTSLARFY